MQNYISNLSNIL